jgi:hypothetical protein
MSWRDRLLTVFGADERVVKKIDQLDERQRQLGHDIANLQMKLDPLYRMVELLEEHNSPPDQRKSSKHGS